MGLLALSTHLGALEWSAIQADFSFTWQYNAGIGTDSSRKSPDNLMFTPGASFYFDWDAAAGGLYFIPGMFFTWTTEEVYKDIARPVDPANQKHMQILGIMIDSPFGYAFRWGKVAMGIQGGPSLYLRFPLWKAQNGTAEISQFWSAYYEKIQLIHLNAAFWTLLPITDSLDFIVGLRIHHPVSNIWSGAPFTHGLQIGLTGSLRFNFI